MIFHQPTNSDADVFNAFLYREIDYGAHFHRGCEILIVLKGVQKAVAGGKQYEVKTGEALFLCPYELHSYEPSAGAITFAIVFSGAYAEAFSSRHENETPAKSLFTIPRETLGFVLSKFFGAGEAETVAALFDHEERGRLSAPEIDGLTVRACLYALLAEFEKNAVYVKSERDDEFTYSAIDYVEKKFPRGYFRGDARKRARLFLRLRFAAVCGAVRDSVFFAGESLPRGRSGETDGFGTRYGYRSGDAQRL